MPNLAPLKWGTEFLVNTTTMLGQNEPAMAGLADGRFVVVFKDDSQGSQTGGDDPSAFAIRAQVFNADGTPSGAEFLVNSTTASWQFDPRVTALSDGGYIVSFTDWSESADDPSAWAVRAQVFDKDGTKSGAEFLVNATTPGSQSDASLTELADGRFVVTFKDTSGTSADNDVYAVLGQIFNADGSRSGGEFVVNATTTGVQEQAVVAPLSSGGFVAVYYDESLGVETGSDDVSGSAVRAQIFDSKGEKVGDEFLVNSTTSGFQSDPQVAELANGRIVVVFADDSATGGDTSGGAIRAQMFNPDGSRFGTEILVNTTTSAYQFSPAIAALPDGRYVVAFSDTSSGNAEVRAQVFNGDGVKSGPEFLINTTTSGDQHQPAISVLADGRFVVAFTDSSTSAGDNSGSAVRAQIFDPRESGITLNGSGLDDEFVGTHFGDLLSGAKGDDWLDGAGGDDTLRGQNGDDTLLGGGGADVLEGGNGNDMLEGGSGSDQLFGGAGNDGLDGGFGFDHLEGGPGNDIYVVDRTQDEIFETGKGGGNDTVTSQSLTLVLGNFANVENASLFGSADLNIFGSSGKNKLTGNDGANLLTGGRGADFLTGGDGADIFDFNSPAESRANKKSMDRITDFQPGTDTFDVSTIDAQSGPGNQAFTFIGTSKFGGSKGELRVKQKGGNTLVSADINGDKKADFAVILDGTHTLVAGDFLL